MYILIKLQNDTTTTSFTYDNYSDALAAFHSELAYRAEGRTSTMCAILDRAGDLVKHERWDTPDNGVNTEV